MLSRYAVLTSMPFKEHQPKAVIMDGVWNFINLLRRDRTIRPTLDYSEFSAL